MQYGSHSCNRANLQRTECLGLIRKKPDQKLLDLINFLL